MYDGYYYILIKGNIGVIHNENKHTTMKFRSTVKNLSINYHNVIKPIITS